jgi:hypothetical protein
MFGRIYAIDVDEKAVYIKPESTLPATPFRVYAVDGVFQDIVITIYSAWSARRHVRGTFYIDGSVLVHFEYRPAA